MNQKRNFTKALAILLSLAMIFSLFVTLGSTGVSAINAWAPNTAYAVGDLVTYNGSAYQCLQAHTSLVGWEPPNVPSLWQLQSGTPAPTSTPTPTPNATPTPTPNGTSTPSPTPTPTPTSGPTATPGSSVNAAAGKTAITSSTTLTSPAYITDGDKNTNNYAGVDQNLQWIQIDLGQSYNLNKVNIWHYFGDGRTYHDVIVRLSNDSAFSSGVTTVFNNDTNNSAGLGTGADAEYAESSAGKTITFSQVNARYVRLYTNGSSANVYNHYVEVEAWTSGGGATPTPTPTPTATPTPTPTPTGATPTPTPTSAPIAQAMFDDFSYSSSSEMSSFNWTVRSGSGGPGPSGCSWSPSNVTFLTDPNNSANKLMRLSATSNGTPAGTSQAEIVNQQKFFEGTYAARIKFNDVPTSGTPDGDGINETFFTISPLAYDNDPNYSECDFEYLANGGWGVTGPTMWNTTWYTYCNNPWSKDNIYNYDNVSYSGWHTCILVVSGGVVNYYVDGVLKASHTGKYYPRKLMSIDFNIWYLPEALLTNSTSRTYSQDVDWVYFAKNTALTPAQVDANIQNYRTNNINRTDNVN